MSGSSLCKISKSACLIESLAKHQNFLLTEKKNPTSVCFWIYHQCKGPWSSCLKTENEGVTAQTERGYVEMKYWCFLVLGVLGGFSSNLAANKDLRTSYTAESVGTYAPVSPKPRIPPSCTEYSRLPSASLSTWTWKTSCWIHTPQSLLPSLLNSKL